MAGTISVEPEVATDSLAELEVSWERLRPLQRLEILCDPGTMQVIRSSVRSPRITNPTAGDGVVAGTGTVNGRPIACFAQDSSFAGGSLGEAQADSIVRVLNLARDAKMPVVGLTESAGARLQEAMYGLGGYGRIFAANVHLSGLVPQISVVTGTCAGGGAYSPALTDFVVMAKSSVMFLTGPRVVRDAVGEELTPEALGGPRVHQKNGVCHFVVPTELDAVLHARRLLSYLPQNCHEETPRAEPLPPLPGDPGDVLPEGRTAVYDVKDVIARIVDAGRLVEVAPRWAQNVVTGLARIDGRPVGIVANQPRYLGGVLEVEGCQKAAAFIRTCNSYGLPLVVAVDTPGFMPGSKQEKVGIIRHGSELVRAFAAATVPRVTVVLRKAYGGAYIAMNSKDLGASLAFAWTDAEIGVMGAPQAVEVVHRRELERAENRAELLARLTRIYESEHCTADGAACSGFVDEVIEPCRTRDRLIAALNTFDGQLAARPSVHRLGA